MDMTEIHKVAANGRVVLREHHSSLYDVYLGMVRIGTVLELDSGRTWALTDCAGVDKGRVDGGMHHAVAALKYGDPNAHE